MGWSWRLLTAALLALACGYLVHGTYVQFSRGAERSDLQLRWNERRQLVHGVNPYDISAVAPDRPRSASEIARLKRFDLQHSQTQVVSGYPPWGLAASIILLLPGPFVLSQVWHLLLSATGLALVAHLAFTLGRRHSPRAAWLLAAATLALAGNGASLRLGQYGLILNGLLILACHARHRGRPDLAGLAIGLAAIKPSFTLLQLLVAAIRGHWRVLASAAALCAIGSISARLATGTLSPEIMVQMLRQSQSVTRGSTSLSAVLGMALGQGTGAILSALAAIAATTWISWRYRNEAMLVSVAAAAIFGRIAVYHRQYDDVMLVFPMLALLAIALAEPTRRRVAIALAFLLSLLAPLPYRAYTPGMILCLSAIWLCGCAAICRDAALLTRWLRGGDLPAASVSSRSESQSAAPALAAIERQIA